MKYKLAFTVPLDSADEVRAAIGEAGAGRSDKYSFASFSVQGVGRFLPEEGSNPTIGEIGEMTEVDEERVECQIEEEYVNAVLEALRSSHPYEEIAFDLYPLEDRKI
jgi:hypothetical protein